MKNHPMRRSRQALGESACKEILARCTSGVLALQGSDDYPYAVPLSYLFRDDMLYFHCAQQGHKLEALRHNSKVSFCVIAQDEIVPEKFTTCYRSVIVFGEIAELTDQTKKRDALIALAEKYTPNDPLGCQREAEGALDRVCVLAMHISQMTGKEAIELVRRQENN